MRVYVVVYNVQMYTMYKFLLVFYSNGHAQRKTHNSLSTNTRDQARFVRREKSVHNRTIRTHTTLGYREDAHYRRSNHAQMSVANVRLLHPQLDWSDLCRSRHPIRP